METQQQTLTQQVKNPSPIQFLINLLTTQRNLCLDSLEHLLPLSWEALNNHMLPENTYSGRLEDFQRSLQVETLSHPGIIHWSCKLTLFSERGSGGQPPVKSEVQVKAQSRKQADSGFGGRRSRISRGAPEARTRLCVCRASFLMTFAMGGVPHAGPRQ